MSEFLRHRTCDLRVLNEMSLMPHLPCAVKITCRERLSGSCFCELHGDYCEGNRGTEDFFCRTSISMVFISHLK